MTIFEFALYRYAAGLMTAAERARAEKLAARADEGDAAAVQAFKNLTMQVIHDAKNREARNGKES